jgi:hypothetical protein
VDLGLTEEEAYLTLPQLEADIHRETAFVWLVKWLAKMDEELKDHILYADPEENSKRILGDQGKRQLISSIFDLIMEIRDGDKGVQ